MILKCHKSYYACKFNLKGVSYQMYLNLFQTALNIEDPWFIKNIEFAHESNQLDIWIDFKVGSKFDCPICNKPGCTAYDSKEKTWRHLNFFQYKTYLHCRVPRAECEICKPHQVIVPWARELSGFTLLMDALIMLLSQNCLLYTSDAADEEDSVDLGGRRIIK